MFGISYVTHITRVERYTLPQNRLTHRLNPMCDASLITDDSFDHILVEFRLLCLFSSHNPLLSINFILDGSFFF